MDESFARNGTDACLVALAMDRACDSCNCALRDSRLAGRGARRCRHRRLLCRNRFDGGADLLPHLFAPCENADASLVFSAADDLCRGLLRCLACYLARALSVLGLRI